MRKIFKNVPLPVIALVASLLCPTELSVYLGGLRLPPHRMVLLIVVPFAAWRLLFGAPRVRLRAFDLFFLAFGAWTLLAYSLQPPGVGAGGIETGGSEALDSVGGYLVARAYIRTLATFAAALRLLAGAVLVSGLIALPEMLSGHHLAHEVMQAVTGQFVPPRTEERFGLTRAYGTFDHPIHLGTFSAALLALFWYGTRTWTGRLFSAGFVGMATLTALSSAPILGLVLQGGLIAWDLVTRGLKGRVIMTVGVIIIALALVSLISSRSVFALIAAYLTIDAWTGYYRLIIWENGIANIMAHPWIGIGLAEWDRPWWMVSSSVDAYWLLITMRTGVPALLLLVTAITLLAWRTAHVSSRHPDRLLRRYAKAWFISFIALCLVGCTVHYWNVLACFFFFFLGLAGWIADPQKQARPVRKSVRNPAPDPVSGPGSGVASRPAHGRPRRRRQRRQPLPTGALQPA